MIRPYYELTKPGIIYGNALAAAAGFFFASASIPVDWALFAAMFVGLSSVIASACVFNNIADRYFDARMERTKSRALVSGRVSPGSALVFGLALGVLGAAVLWFYTTPLAFGTALLGFAVYVFWYTPLKPKSAAALFVGAIAGATPPLVGYTAVTGTLDLYALMLFAVLYVWQIPHFLAIAVYRYEEYAAAGVPLYIKKAPSAVARRRARLAFYSSLVFLLLFCLTLIVQRWIR